MGLFDELKEKAGELGDKAKEGFEAAKDKAEDLVEAAKDKAEDVAGDVKDRFGGDDSPADQGAPGSGDAAPTTQAKADDAG